MTDEISIHAPRMGSDMPIPSARWNTRHFNPRSPHGERRTKRMAKFVRTDISIHAPRMGSDHEGGWKGTKAEFISIHAPRMGSDC